jgi:hypothetical protein
MKYVLDNSPNTESYELIEYSINKVNKTITLRLQKSITYPNQVVDTRIIHHTFQDVYETIIDPDWKDKPQGFVIHDPLTWGDLSWDDIPRKTDPDKLYVSKIIEKTQEIEEILIQKLIGADLIPTNGEYK